MPTDEVAGGERVEEKQGGAKQWALRDTTGDVVCQGFSLSQGDMLSSPGEVGWKPVVNSQRDR